MGYVETIQNLRQTGVAAHVYASTIQLDRNGHPEVDYINYAYEPYYEEGKSEVVDMLMTGNAVTDKILAKRICRKVSWTCNSVVITRD